MDDHAGRLVDHRDLIIFEDNFKRDIFRQCFYWASFRKVNLDRVTGFHAVARLCQPIVDDDVAAGYCSLDPGTALAGHPRGQKGVKTLAVAFRIDRDGDFAVAGRLYRQYRYLGTVSSS